MRLSSSETACSRRNAWCNYHSWKSLRFFLAGKKKTRLRLSRETLDLNFLRDTVTVESWKKCSWYNCALYFSNITSFWLSTLRSNLRDMAHGTWTESTRCNFLFKDACGLRIRTIESLTWFEISFEKKCFSIEVQISYSQKKIRSSKIASHGEFW